jgi:hypothetical protein
MGKPSIMAARESLRMDFMGKLEVISGRRRRHEKVSPSHRKFCFSSATSGIMPKPMCKFFVKNSALSKQPRTCFHPANPCPRAWNKRPLHVTNAL